MRLLLRTLHFRAAARGWASSSGWWRLAPDAVSLKPWAEGIFPFLAFMMSMNFGNNTSLCSLHYDNLQMICQAKFFKKCKLYAGCALGVDCVHALRVVSMLWSVLKAPAVKSLTSQAGVFCCFQLSLRDKEGCLGYNKRYLLKEAFPWLLSFAP